MIVEGDKDDPKRLAIEQSVSHAMMGTAEFEGSAEVLITLSEHFRRLRDRNEATEDEAFSLSLRPIAHGTNDFVIENVARAKTMDDVMRTLARAYNLVHNGQFNRVIQRGDCLVYEIDDGGFPYAVGATPNIQRSLMETLLIFVHAVVVTACGLQRSLQPVSVRTRRSASDGTSGLLEFWRCTLVQGAPCYALAYPLPEGARPVTQGFSASQVFATIEALIAEREERFVTNDLVDVVKASLARGGDQTDAARAAGLSVATLRRRLAERGTSFREVRAEALARRAASMLERGWSITDTSRELNFADIRSFNRAFKSWHGVTPAKYRTNGKRAASAKAD